jgi:hypothetical protein
LVFFSHCAAAAGGKMGLKNEKCNQTFLQQNVSEVNRNTVNRTYLKKEKQKKTKRLLKKNKVKSIYRCQTY